MGRTTNQWIVNVYLDKEKIQLIKVLTFDTLQEIAHCLDRKLYEVSNQYHKIKKPSDIFEYLYIYKSYI